MRQGYLATLVVMGALLAGCSRQSLPERANPQPISGTSGPVLPLAPESLIGSWTIGDVADPGAGTILRLAGGDLYLVGSRCGSLGGSWRASSDGTFLADIFSASTAAVEGIPGCAKASQETPEWLRRVTAFQFDGTGLPVLLDARAQPVARLIPGATPTPEPDMADDALEPPVITDEARRALRPAVALPATLVPVDRSRLVGRWVPRTGHKAAYVQFTADGEWRGSDGCNDESGRWITAASGTLLTTERGTTLAFCADSVSVGGWLGTARRAGFDGQVLVLVNAEGAEAGRLFPVN
ncbi:META domain-containing protein [Micromonospora sp. NPDC048835]|uniref:META domain-containing protein n=1 Tax=Micromonospora sp. NPDC048835 TaxID=3155147 RepID=UPI0033DCB2E6